MSRFTAVLRDLSERLNLPQPARSRILLEISGDLDGLYRSFRDRGLSEADAEREALARVDLSGEALEALCRVHGGWFRRSVDTLAHRAGPGWERAVLVLLVLGCVALSGGLLQAVPMSRAAGIWLLPVGCVALCAVVIAVWKAWVLLLVGDHRPKRLRRGLDALLRLSVLQPVLAFGALWITALGAMRSIGRDPLAAGMMTMRWLERALALLVPSLGMALITGLLWFLLLRKVLAVEHHEATALLADPIEQA